MELGSDIDALQRILELNNRQQHWVARLDQVSQSFLGKPYLLGALGEGEAGEFDQSPLYRFDGFDCLTYVNTVLALLFSNHPVDFKYHLTRLNYRNGLIRYQNRHHFMSVDWNKANADLGYIADLTPHIKNEQGYSVCDYAVAYIDKPNWFKRRTEADLKYRAPLQGRALKKKLSSLRALSSEVQGMYACTPYLSLNLLFNCATTTLNDQIISQLPDALIVEIVRPNWNLTQQIGTHLNVSHLGFLLKLNDELIFRHASSEQRCVVDQPFAAYLNHCLKSPTIKGVNLQKISFC